MTSYKKLTITVVGLILVMVVFLGCAVLLVVKPVIAPQIVPLAQVVVGAVSAIVAVFTSAQAAVDFKTISKTNTTTIQ